MLLISEEEILQILQSMKVIIPNAGRLPIEILEKKLARALDASQNLSTILNKADQIDLNSVKRWPQDNGLIQACVRMSFTEAGEVLQNYQRFTPQAILGGSMNDNPFFVLRWMFGMIADASETGRIGCIFTDSELHSALLIKFRDVRAANSHTPIFIVEYEVTDINTSNETFRFKSGFHSADPKILPEQSMLQHRAYIMLLQILENNSVRINQDFREEPFVKRSFLLPLGPLPAAEIGALTKDRMCHVCGKEAGSNCSRCRVVPYCSKECQKIDWKKHKSVCNNVDKGPWIPFSFYTGGFTPSGERVPNRRSGLEESIVRGKQDQPVYTSRASTKLSSSNKHSGEPFLVKVQSNPTKWIMLYDRSKALDVAIEKDGSPKFKQLETVMKARGITKGIAMKVYLWAKRTGDREVSLNLTNVPNQQIAW